MRTGIFVVFFMAIVTESARVAKSKQRVGETQAETLSPTDVGSNETSRLDLSSPGSDLLVDGQATPRQALASFSAWASKHAKGFELFLVPLIEGVLDAGFGKFLTWTPPEGGVLKDEFKGHLKLVLSHSEIYGELAASSRLPLMWKLAKEVTFTFTQTHDSENRPTVTAYVNGGLATGVSKQAWELYQAVMKTCKSCDPQKCQADPTSDKIPPCLAEEIKAAGKYLSSNWKKMKNDKRMVSKALKTSYGSMALYTAFKAKGGDWGATFYSLMAAQSGKITSLEINADGKVAATTESTSTPESKAVHLFSKSQMMGAQNLKKNKNNLKMVAKFARSAINVALMMAHGFPPLRKQYQELGIPAGDPDAICNVLRRCTKTAIDDCKDKVPGRLHWSATIPNTFL